MKIGGWRSLLRTALSGSKFPDKQGKYREFLRFEPRSNVVAGQNLNADILMMQTTENRDRDNGAGRLGASTVRGLLIQRDVGSDLVVVGRVGPENATQVRLAGYHKMIEAFAPDRPD
jgi:hypothetical protein